MKRYNFYLVGKQSKKLKLVLRLIMGIYCKIP